MVLGGQQAFRLCKRVHTELQTFFRMGAGAVLCTSVQDDVELLVAALICPLSDQ